MASTLDKAQIEDLITFCGSSPTKWKGEEMQICCPVHGESNPSCGVNAELQIYHCFSCGSAGNFAKMLYLSLPDEFGYDPSSEDSQNKTWYKAQTRAREFLKDRYELEYHELHGRLRVVKRFHEVQESHSKKSIELRPEIPLWKIAPFQSGKKTYKYFFDRGFTKEDMRQFSIGYDDSNETITIPVFYEDKKLAGVIGRYIDPRRRKNQRYKIYDHFQRGDTLFPLDHLEVKDDTIILVEGQFDAMWCHKFGFKNTLAMMTDHLTEEQKSSIISKCSRVIYIGDNDERGLEAREKNYALLKKDVDFLIVDFPNHGKDPCDWSQEELEDMINNAHSPLRRKLKRFI